MLIPHNSEKLLVTQSTKLVEARYSLTVGEQRLILLMISMIQPNDKDFKDYDINIVDFLHLLNITGKGNYKRIQNITESLVSRVVKIKEDDGLLQSSWLSSAKYLDNEGVVLLSFDPKLKPHLLQLKSHFTKYHLSAVIQFRSIYTIRIYTILKAHQYRKFVDFYYQDLREILGISSDEYPKYEDFRRRVLDQAKKEFQEKDETGIYKSDVSFRLEILERRNRKIHKIKLHIIEHKKQKPLPIALEAKNPKPTKSKDPIIERLIYYGIAVKQANALLKGHKETIQASIELFERDLENSKVIKNKSGYLVALISRGAGGESQYEKEKQDGEIKKTKKKEQKKQKEQEKVDEFQEDTIRLFAIIEQVEFNILKDKIKEIMIHSPFMGSINTSMEIGLVEKLTDFNHLTSMFTPDTDRRLSKYVLKTLQKEYLVES